jgi:hypothetical protein
MWPSNLPDSTPFCENTIVCQSRNLFLGASFNDGIPSVFKTYPMVFGVGVFGCGSGPFCVVLLFPAGETHFCLVFVWFLICLEFIEPRCFMMLQFVYLLLTLQNAIVFPT